MPHSTNICVKIIRTLLGKSLIPKLWKKGLTVLAYKKGLADHPANCWPITLEPVIAKVLKSLIRNRIYAFLCKNQYIETNIQKGFWTGISGTIEHTELMSHLISHARQKQRSLVVTLIDLKNAFGEVHHELICAVLRFHHILRSIQKFILHLYDGFHISDAANGFFMDPIPVQRGVLQGDCLSPLIFNMRVNTLITTTDQEKVKCLGYVYENTLSPKHWFQFADDTAIATALEYDNQLLLNVFTKWSKWADFTIRVDKCHVFGIRKNKTDSCQYHLPKAIVNAQRIPVVPLEESFDYLGKSFNYKMSTGPVEVSLCDGLKSYLQITDKLNLHPASKIKIINEYIYSKLRWWLTIYNFSETWVVQNLDNSVLYFVRKWLNLQPSANTSHLRL